MPRNTNEPHSKRPWKPRFSLKAFFGACLLFAVAIAWVSQHCREYLAEQRLVEHLTRRLSATGMMSVVTNGDVQSFILVPE